MNQKVQNGSGMAEDEQFGDEQFREFMNKQQNKEDPIIIIIEALKYKINAVSNIYSKTLDAYHPLPENDPLKAELREYLKVLMEQILRTVDQFNYALLNEEDLGDEEEEPDA